MHRAIEVLCETSQVVAIATRLRPGENGLQRRKELQGGGARRPGIPTAGLVSQVLVSKYLDHLPPYRQAAIYGASRRRANSSTTERRAFVGRAIAKVCPV